MRWLDRLLGRKYDSADLLRDLYGGRTTASGKTVSSTTAIDVSTVFACCRVVGEGLAQVPLKLMQESPDGRTRLPAKEHPLYNLLAFKPNPWQTSFEFRETLAWHLLLTGNAYVFVGRVGREIVQLYPIEPSRVLVTRHPDQAVTYHVTAENGMTQEFPAKTIWHLKGPSWNSWIGVEAVKAAREAIGLAIAAEESASALQKNGVRPSGTWSVDGTLRPDQFNALSSWINDHIAGPANAGKALIVDRAAKWQSTQMSGVDAQALETRRFQIEEICRFFRVMPIMVGYSDKTATYASAEQMFLAHVTHTLAPWYQRIEQSIDAYLLTSKERASGFYSCFVEEGLLRGSIAETQAALLGYVNGGLMTPNEGRAKLDLNPMDDGESDKLRVPANIVGAPAQNAPKTQENTPKTPENGQKTG